MRNFLSTRILITFTCIAILGFCAGCMSGDGIRAYPPQRGIDARLVGSSNLFGFDLLTRIARENSGGNFLISPMGIFLSASLASMGAEKTTQESIARVLRTTHIERAELEQGVDALLNALVEADTLVDFTTVLALWTSKDISPKGAFVKQAENSFRAVVKEADFNDPAVTHDINNWLKESTGGHIAESLASIDRDTLLLFMSAVYFSGTWTNVFDPERTTPGSFFPMTGSETTVPMMSRTGKYEYLETELFRAIALPYGKERFSMYIFLPQEDRHITDLIRELTAGNWSNWMGRFTSTEVSLTLPRFQLISNLELDPYLAEMGMKEAFQSKEADFSGIAEPPPNAYIKHVMHTFALDVNEGTQYTPDGTRDTESASLPDTDLAMTVDRPFFCAVRDELTGIILMAGFINTHPEE